MLLLLCTSWTLSASVHCQLSMTPGQYMSLALLQQQLQQLAAAGMGPTGTSARVGRTAVMGVHRRRRN